MLAKHLFICNFMTVVSCLWVAFRSEVHVCWGAVGGGGGGRHVHVNIDFGEWQIDYVFIKQAFAYGNKSVTLKYFQKPVVRLARNI